MAAPSQPFFQPPASQSKPQTPFAQNALSQAKVHAVIERVKVLKQAGFTEESNPELAKMVTFLKAMAQQRKWAAEATADHSMPQTNGHVMTGPRMNGSPAPNGNPLTSGPIPTQAYPAPSQSPVSFTPDQINALRAQIQAFKLISRGMPVPDSLQVAVRVPNQAVPELEKLLHGGDINSRVVDSAVKVHKSAPASAIPAPGTSSSSGEAVAEIKAEEEIVQDMTDMPKGPFLEDNVDSGVYPYNAYMHPFTHLKRDPNVDPALFATRLQRLLIPSIMPAGLDLQEVIAERNRFVDARIEQRIRELEDLPALMGDGGLEPIVPDGDAPENKENATDLKSLIHPPPGTHGKLRAVIELKALRLLDKQRQMRAMVAERLVHGSTLPLNRTEFRRTRKPTIRDARMTEQAERKQRAERERRAKAKHVEQLKTICDHGREVHAVNRTAQDRIVKLSKAIASFHAHTEKEEQKRIERLAKERLKALKADDEEAYMKLIDTAKDTRITHLLRQTDTFLDSLAQAVMEQQKQGDPSWQPDEEPTSEETFGAQKQIPDEDKGKLDYYAVAHRIKEKVTRQPSLLIGGTLKDYQLKGLQWMVSLYNNKLNGILADEMGLGKTIQTISLVAFLIEVKKQRGPYLVIVPLSTMTNWSGEFAKWAPGVRAISYKGNPTQRRALQNEIRGGQFQVLLTTYEYIIKDRPVLSRMKWVHMIIDEGHRMKNTQSKLSQTLTQHYHSRYRLILTGTPLQNNLPELWSLLNFVLPKIFNSVKSFDEWFNTPFANSGTGDKIELNEEEALLIIRRLHKVLRPFLLRRLKKDVESELPDKVEKVIKVKMSALQSQLYKQMKKYKMIADGKDNKGKPGGVKGLSNELMQLRKICQHPFLFESVEDNVNPSGYVNDLIFRTSGKIELLSRILPKFFATDHRVLIFFQMTKVMDIMEDFLKMMNWKYLRLDGGTKTEDRAGHVALFNAEGSDYKVFILSTRAGGLGLNLQSADTVVIFDSDWNPHADLQAQDRAHRIGQTKVVRILRFITEKSVEEAMFARARYKLDIDDKVIQAGRFDNKSTQEEQEEFLRSILEADQEEENEEAGDMNDEEINEIIARNEEEVGTFREFDIKRDRDAMEAWRASGNRGKPPPPLISLDELPDCYRTDEPFANSNELEEFEGRGARKRTAVNYNDGLSDDQWAIALEEGEDIQELSERARAQKDKRAANKLLKEVDSRNSPAFDDTPRGRKAKKGKAKVIDIPFDTPSNGKRKRGKAMSVSPSVDGDEPEDRDPKRRKTKPAEVPAAVKEKMKKAYNECYKAVLQSEDDTSRRRCELFKELPDKKLYPDYYEVIKQPIAMSTIRKRITSNYYKSVLDFREDWRLMFNNARTYNQEGSWVYNDADEMEKIFNATFDRTIVGSGLPGAPAGAGSGAYDSAPTPMDDDERPLPKSKNGRKQVLSDDEYLTPSDDE
ncbi:uncharacterized protein PHACADRAFT_179732 [Phanerochaete carnosa HHB-10118-sp]|uniref:Uncharacterized protein n=1 Tax=Phanerochaete carnosa (strain HHB-10118-sp) TaxID=650164 RepID=K5W930_PHACS|nr:uncharacterized protein PHACADRAFT_179732 [Phanerochaete carnosa HHB-10118-sp]EKM60438.1 hypothetical protein PHACADRAFT_179732 [Phanerochaete carnosa HHB-10118-sp]